MDANRFNRKWTGIDSNRFESNKYAGPSAVSNFIFGGDLTRNDPGVNIIDINLAQDALINRPDFWF